jgi:hypothetical protein
MSSEADLARSGAVSGWQAMLKSAAPDAGAHPLAAIVTPGSWDAGTTSRRHAE